MFLSVTFSGGCFTGSPTPCGWRLESSTSRIERKGNAFSHLAIDIGRSMIAEGVMHHSKQVAPVSITSFEHQENSAPPPYSDQYPRFCSQCHVPRSDLTAKFCSSCGHSFNRY
ncbi:unnamed protein product [Adineta steineri]|uniref:Uncharacterized protein n=1 Tax=Adineta steineri TaxID=433720 RepID=A0A819PIM0_9BILA|nr:unnamed protein product [Adineta steineri]